MDNGWVRPVHLSIPTRDAVSASRATPAASGSSGSSSGSDGDEAAGDAPEQALPRRQVIFCSRTHSQLSQFVGELRRTRFAESLSAAAVASRQVRPAAASGHAGLPGHTSVLMRWASTRATRTAVARAIDTLPRACDCLALGPLLLQRSVFLPRPARWGRSSSLRAVRPWEDPARGRRARRSASTTRCGGWAARRASPRSAWTCSRAARGRSAPRARPRRARRAPRAPPDAPRARPGRPPAAPSSAARPARGGTSRRAHAGLGRLPQGCPTCTGRTSSASQAARTTWPYPTLPYPT
jgi:hypothetical protein